MIAKHYNVRLVRPLRIRGVAFSGPIEVRDHDHPRPTIHLLNIGDAEHLIGQLQRAVARAKRKGYR